MKFYIVTPTYNSWSWLQSCIKSVADQATEQLHVHHHVQDGGSTDGSAEQLAQWQQASQHIANYTFSYESGRDNGMYDAINRAWDKMPTDTDFTAHLNSDEQYLPNTLAQITPYFSKHPKADVLLGTYLITDDQLGYIAHRRPVVPKLWSSWLNCTCITCSSFYRASSFRKHQMSYDTQWKVIGDVIFFRDLLIKGVRFNTIPLLTSSFVCTGDNLAWSPKAAEEWRRHIAASPKKYLRLKKFPYLWVNLKRRIVDLLSDTPKQYQIFEGDKQGQGRSTYSILHPTCKWGARQKADPCAYQRED